MVKESSETRGGKPGAAAASGNRDASHGERQWVPHSPLAPNCLTGQRRHQGRATRVATRSPTATLDTATALLRAAPMGDGRKKWEGTQQTSTGTWRRPLTAAHRSDRPRRGEASPRAGQGRTRRTATSGNPGQRGRAEAGPETTTAGSSPGGESHQPATTLAVRRAMPDVSISPHTQTAGSPRQGELPAAFSSPPARTTTRRSTGRAAPHAPGPRARRPPPGGPAAPWS